MFGFSEEFMRDFFRHSDPIAWRGSIGVRGIPRLFEFPDCTTIDLDAVWRISGVLHDPIARRYNVKITRYSKNEPEEFLLAGYNADQWIDEAYKAANDTRAKLIRAWERWMNT